MVSVPFWRRKQATTGHDNGATPSHHIDQLERNSNNHAEPLSPTQVRRATRTRLIWGSLTSFFLLLALIFLILVEVGNTSVGSVENRIYFLYLDLSQVIPQTVPDAVFINSIAQTLGLHDFYTVGLWGYCEGYFGQGVTSCSKPQTLYWFNPVEILISELLSGSSRMCGSAKCDQGQILMGD